MEYVFSSAYCCINILSSSTLVTSLNFPENGYLIFSGILFPYTEQKKKTQSIFKIFDAIEDKNYYATFNFLFKSTRCEVEETYKVNFYDKEFQKKEFNKNREEKIRKNKEHAKAKNNGVF